MKAILPLIAICLWLTQVESVFFNPEKCINEATKLQSKFSGTVNRKNDNLSKDYLAAKDRMLTSYGKEYDREVKLSVARRSKEVPNQKQYLQSFITGKNGTVDKVTTTLRANFNRYLVSQSKKVNNPKTRQKALEDLEKRFVRECATDVKKFQDMLLKAENEMKKKAPILEDKFKGVWKVNSPKETNVKALWKKMEDQLRSEFGAATVKNSSVLASERTKKTAAWNKSSKQDPEYFYNEIGKVYRSIRTKIQRG